MDKEIEQTDDYKILKQAIINYSKVSKIGIHQLRHYLSDGRLRGILIQAIQLKEKKMLKEEIEFLEGLKIIGIVTGEIGNYKVLSDINNEIRTKEVRKMKYKINDKNKITFELGRTNQYVKIMRNKKQIGEIFTPSGSSHDTPDSIQVCGFSKMFDYWGCAVYGDGLGNAKKDIQLFFDNSIPQPIHVDLGEKVCPRCFYPYNRCECPNMIKELRGMADKIEKQRDEVTKVRVCEVLK